MGENKKEKKFELTTYFLLKIIIFAAAIGFKPLNCIKIMDS